MFKGQADKVRVCTLIGSIFESLFFKRFHRKLFVEACANIPTICIMAT